MSTSQRQPAPQVIIVKQKSSGCLFWAVAVLLFGWLGVIWWASWKTLKAAWKLNAWGWRVIWQWTVAGWNASVRGSKWLTERYGWRGWAVVGGVVVVLAIIGAVTGR